MCCLGLRSVSTLGAECAATVTVDSLFAPPKTSKRLLIADSGAPNRGRSVQTHAIASRVHLGPKAGTEGRPPLSA